MTCSDCKHNHRFCRMLAYYYFATEIYSMPLRLALSALLWSASMSCFASEAMIFAMVYECDAEAVNLSMVKACSTQFSDLAPQANDALVRWQARNAIKAKAMNETCDRAIEASNQNQPSEKESARRLREATKAKIAESFQSRISEKGKQACIESLDQLKTSGGPMDLR